MTEEKYILPKYERRCDNNSSICPYCGVGYQVESEDYSEDTREIECDECGKKYFLHQSFSVYHHTKPDCILNGEEHQYRRVSIKGREAYFCSVCDDCKAIQVRRPPMELRDILRFKGAKEYLGRVQRNDLTPSI